MTSYRDCNADSGIRAYALGSSHMDVAVKDGAIYRYISVSAGRVNLERMIVLALAGGGLNEVITRVVKKRYSDRLA